MLTYQSQQQVGHIILQAYATQGVNGDFRIILRGWMLRVETFYQLLSAAAVSSFAYAEMPLPRVASNSRHTVWSTYR